MATSKSSEKELASNLQGILFEQFSCTKETHICVIYDAESPLAKVITEGYRVALKAHPQSKQSFYDFNAQPHEELIAKIDTFKPEDLVVLVQSHSFRVSVYRWRLELFNRKLKVVEHMRLSYMPEEQFPTYIASLKNDSTFWKEKADKLAALFKKSTHIKVECQKGSILEIDSTMEEPIANTGIYEGKAQNVGGGFPLGEIFSEPKDISKWNGEVEIFAYPGEDHKMVFVEKPFTIAIKAGHVEVEKSSFPQNFLPIIQMMLGENADGKIPVREFGLGLNRSITRTNHLIEATAWERVTGLHLSLGMKHGVYQKKFNKQKEINQRYHIDIYPDVKKIWIAEKLVFENGQFIV